MSSSVTDISGTLAVTSADEEFDAGGAVIMSAGHAIHDTYPAMLSALLPVFMETMALNRAQVGALSLFLRWPSLIQPILGSLADRFHLRELFILAPAVSAVAMSLVGTAPSYVVAAFFLIISGIASASLHAVGPAIVGRLSGNKLGRGMGYWMVGGELGRALGPITIVTAIEWFGIGGTPWLMVGGILASLALWYQLRGVKGNGTMRKAPEALPWRTALREMRWLLIPLMAVVAARNFSMTALSTYLPIFMNDQGTSLWLAGASLSIYEVAGVVGALTGGTISDVIGRRSILLISMLVTPLLMFAFLAVGGIGRLALLLLLGFTALSVMPVNMAMVQEASPRNRAMATGFYLSMTFVVNATAIVILGALGDRFGMETAFIVSAVISLVGLPAVFFLPGKNSKRQGQGSA